MATLEREHRSVADLVARLTPDDFARASTIGSGDWSAKDLVGHLTSWERHALEALEAWGNGLPAPISQALRRRGLNAVNAENVEAVRGRSASDIRRAFDDVHRRLMGEIRSIPEATWDAPPTARSRRSLGDVLGGIVGGPDGPFAHASAHLPTLEAYVMGRARSRREAPAARAPGG